MEAAIGRYAVQNGVFVLVMNCKTGEILAMATLGSFDPNAYLTVADPQTQADLERMRLQYLHWEDLRVKPVSLSVAACLVLADRSHTVLLI